MLDSAFPVARAAFGVGYCDDENLVLPVEINDGIWKFIEHKSLRSMQIG